MATNERGCSRLAICRPRAVAHHVGQKPAGGRLDRLDGGQRRQAALEDGGESIQQRQQGLR